MGGIWDILSNIGECSFYYQQLRLLINYACSVRRPEKFFICALSEPSIFYYLDKILGKHDILVVY